MEVTVKGQSSKRLILTLFVCRIPGQTRVGLVSCLLMAIWLLSGSSSFVSTCHSHLFTQPERGSFWSPGKIKGIVDLLVQWPLYDVCHDMFSDCLIEWYLISLGLNSMLFDPQVTHLFWSRKLVFGSMWCGACLFGSMWCGPYLFGSMWCGPYLFGSRGPSQYTDCLSQVLDSHVKDKTVSRPSYL